MLRNYWWVGVMFIALTSCSSTYFNNANDMGKAFGQVTLQDGTELSGAISFRARTNNIKFYGSDSKEARKILLSDIKFIEIRGNKYAPKLIRDRGSLTMRFLKPLTRDDSRLGLYEFYEEETRTVHDYRGRPYTRDQEKIIYYLETPVMRGQEPLWELSGKQLVPNFDVKMSEVVKDCPALAEKIRNKERGYFYAMITGRDRVDIMLNIIEEYNRCK